MTFHLTLDGRLGTDPELRHTDQGRPWTTMRLAHTPRVKTPTGEWEDGQTGWFAITTYGRLAEACAELRKGQHILVTGRATPRTYSRDGVEHHTLDVTADQVAAIPTPPPIIGSNPDRPAW